MGYSRLQLVTVGYNGVTVGYNRLQWVRVGYNWLQ